MNILLKHITRNMKENLGRTLLIMLSLFIVAILVAIVSLMILYMGMVDDAQSNLASYDYIIHSATGKDILNNVVNEVKEEFDIFALPDLEYGYMKDEENKYISSELYGIKIKDAIDFKFIEIKKDDVALNENEVIITSEIAKKHKLKEGDEFEYYGRNGNKNILKVKYIVKSLANFNFNGTLEIITNEETYLKIVDENEISYLILFGNKLNDNLTKEDIEKIETELGVYIVKNEEAPNMTKDILYPGVIVGILVFAVIFVSLNSIVKIIINERITAIGTFRSIGASKKQVILVLIAELLMYTVIPALVGAVTGVAAIKGMASLVEMILQSYGSTEKINVVNYILPISLITVCVTVAFQMLLSVIELVKVSKISIKDSIFNKQTSTYKYSKTKIIFGIFFLALGIITLIKYKQLTYWYCLAGILSIFVSIALIVPTISKCLIN